MKRFLKIFFYTVIIILVLFQLYPKPKRNVSASINANDITLAYNVPAPVLQVLKTSCYDCHSNNTIYPWYASFQPVALWLGNHIEKGKAGLNFSEFGKYSISKKYKRLADIDELVKKDEMPLSSYTLIHRYAILSSDQKLLIDNWVTALRDSFKTNYPPDSLTRKK